MDIKTTILSKIFDHEALACYGFCDAKGKWDVRVGLCTFLRACAHNPFGTNDRHNRELQDRVVENYVSEYRKKVDHQDGPPICSEKLYNAIKTIFLNDLHGEAHSNRALGILAQAHGASSADCKSLLSTFKEALEMTEINDKFRNQQDREVFCADVLREVLSDFKKEGINFDDHYWNLPVKEKIRSRLAELFADKPDFISRTEALLNFMKREFAFESGMFVLEAALSLYSSELMFSLTESLGFASFSACLFAVIATLPYTTALVEASWQQLASYGDGDGPRNWDEARTNILNHMRNSWEKTVDSDKSFHPAVDAFLNTAFLMSTWGSLAYLGINWFAIRYSTLDLYLNVKASLVTGKDYDTTIRDALAAFVSGFVRGLMKNLQMVSLSDASGVIRAYYDAMITYISAVLGYILYIGITQFLTVEETKKHIDGFLASEQMKTVLAFLDDKRESLTNWLGRKDGAKLKEA